MRSINWCAVAAVCAGLLAGCGDASAENPAGGGAAVVAAGGQLAGTGKTQDGRPLESFEVEYSGHASGVLGGYDANGNLMASASGTVDGANGAYKVNLPDGQYNTRASVKVKWHGRPFTFRLDPADGEKENKRFEVSRANGFTRDYVWKLTGPKPGVDEKDEGSSYATNTYGAVVELDMNVEYRPAPDKSVRGLYYSDPDAVVEFTLTPKGKAIDGSDVKPVVERVPVKKSGTYSGLLRGVPVADYTMTAKIVDPAKGERPAKLSMTGAEVSKDYKTSSVKWQENVDVIFDTPYDGMLRDWGARPVRVYVGE